MQQFKCTSPRYKPDILLEAQLSKITVVEHVTVPVPLQNIVVQLNSAASDSLFY